MLACSSTESYRQSSPFVKFCKDNPQEKKSISCTGTFHGVDGKSKEVGKLPYFAIGLSL